jgi:hypothetical protein
LLLTLITILVTAGLIALWPNLRRTAAARRPAGGVLRDSVLGLAQLRLPPGWRPATELNEGAPLQALDPLRSRYLLVLSESRADFAATVDLHEHSARTREMLGKSVTVLSVRGPQEREVGGFKAVQYELDATCDATFLTYLHTTVLGRRAFHQILGWATRSRYDRQTFERLLDAFEELDGPDPLPPPAPADLTLSMTPLSRYNVH